MCNTKRCIDNRRCSRKVCLYSLVLVALLVNSTQPAQAQWTRSSSTSVSHSANKRTGVQSSRRLSMRPIQQTGLSAAKTSTLSNRGRGLPPTSTDSFVRQAGIHAEHIFGDESLEGPPPYQYFQKLHRINSGINNERDSGLTTEHGSMMPDAWGRDEFSGAPEFSQSGTKGYETTGVPFRTPVKNPEKAFLPEKQQFPTGFRIMNPFTNYDKDRLYSPTTPYYPQLRLNTSGKSIPY